MLVGYARVSTMDQTPQLQIDVLQQAGCERIFMEKASGAQRDRPQLAAALAYLRAGDTLVIWRFDRLGCSFKQVVEHIEEVQRRQLGLRSLHEQIDTTGPDGPAQLRVIAALVTCDRMLVSECTRTGLGIARARSRHGGRKPKMAPDLVQQAAQLMKNPAMSLQQICQTLGISRSTLYRYVSPTGEVRNESGAFTHPPQGALGLVTALERPSVLFWS